MGSYDQREYEFDRSLLVVQMSPDTFPQDWKEGRSMTVEQVLEGYARK